MAYFLLGVKLPFQPAVLIFYLTKSNVKIVKNYFIVAIIALFNLNLLFAQGLKENFDVQSIPQAPDYSNENNWSALPWKNDSADDVPTDKYTNKQDKAVVDVFFVHPTTISKAYGKWNADLTDEKLNKKVDNLPIHHQASVFNGSGRVFAPRYRQANYEAFMTLGTSNSNKALALAYSDVKAAFLYYLENWNEGKPFIIAGHSQGSFHNIQLVKEVIDTTALLNQMVAAYLVGMPVVKTDFKNCKPCQQEDDTNCFLTWNTMKKKSYPQFYEEYFKNAICHNPLSWETNEFYCSEDYHEGMVPKEFRKFYKNMHGAKVHKGVLWVDAVKIPGIPFSRLVKNWHIGDYNLFYGNIRENVAVRVNEYLKSNNFALWKKHN